METKYIKSRGFNYEAKSFLNTFAASFLSVMGMMILLIDPSMIQGAELSAATFISVGIAFIRMVLTAALVALQNVIRKK